MLMQLRDYSDEVTGPGFVPIPAKAGKRARTKLLPGSCLIIQPMPGNPGAAQAAAPPLKTTWCPPTHFTAHMRCTYRWYSGIGPV